MNLGHSGSKNSLPNTSPYHMKTEAQKELIISKVSQMAKLEAQRVLLPHLGLFFFPPVFFLTAAFEGP